MKKLILLSAGAVLLSFTNAYADDHAEFDGKKAVTKAEFLKKAEERFEKMDSNNDGEISREEAKSARKVFKEEMKERRAERKEKMKQKREDANE